MKTLLMLAAVGGFAACANAQMQLVEFTTLAPPATLGGMTMNPAAFRSDIFAETTSTDIGGGFTTSFTSSVSVRQIGFGWATWSHGYTGNVYYSNGFTNLGGNLSPGVKAFQLYAEPNPFGIFSMTVVGASAGHAATITDMVEGSAGARGWGFYDLDGEDIAGWQISSDVDFAVGEFAAGVPAPATLGVLGLGAMITGRRRRA